jgi:hypothetical protein
MNKTWLRLSFYVVCLSTSFLIEFFSPQTKQIFCTPLDIRNQDGINQISGNN